MNVVLEDNEIELRTDVEGIINTYDIYLKKTNEHIGYVVYRGYHYDVMLGDMGAVVYTKYRGHNYAFKAIKLISELLNENDIDNYWLVCDKYNIASKALIEKLGPKNRSLTIGNKYLFFECKTIEKDRKSNLQI